MGGGFQIGDGDAILEGVLGSLKWVCASRVTQSPVGKRSTASWINAFEKANGECSLGLKKRDAVERDPYRS